VGASNQLGHRIEVFSDLSENSCQICTDTVSQNTHILYIQLSNTNFWPLQREDGLFYWALLITRKPISNFLKSLFILCPFGALDDGQSPLVKYPLPPKEDTCAAGAYFILHFVMPDITSLPLRRRLVVHPAFSDMILLHYQLYWVHATFAAFAATTSISAFQPRQWWFEDQRFRERLFPIYTCIYIYIILLHSANPTRQWRG
jgi:hypothetical protein